LFYTSNLHTTPVGAIYTKLYNRIINSRVIPQRWKEFFTTLLPKPGKQGQYDQVSSWRPIALLECAYKILATLLRDQLSRWVVDNELLHPLQKSLGPHDGCAEHNFLIRAILDKYYSQLVGAEFHATMLDNADAFGSVSVEIILKLLGRMGVGADSCDLIRQLYKDCSSAYKCDNTVTGQIPILVGVRQGCPLSMLLFNIAINPVLLELDQQSYGGMIIANHRVSCLAYADDLVLLADNQSHMQLMVDKAVELTNIIGIKFRPSKCARIAIPHNPNNRIQIYGSAIPEITEGEFVVYLGGHFSENIRIAPVEKLAEVTRETVKITESVLFPWQKLQAYMVYLHSKLIFAFRIFYIPYGTIDGKSYSLDNVIRLLHKKVLGLQKNASNAYLYTPRENGGVGIKSLLDEYLIQSLAHSFQMIACSDTTTMDAAVFSLKRGATGPRKTRLLSIEAAISWLNAGTQSGKIKNWWAKIKFAIHKIKNLHQISVSLVQNERGICLHLHQSLVWERRLPNGEIEVLRDETSENMLLTPLLKSSVSKTLRRLVEKSWTHKWNVQSSAGRIARSLQSTIPFHSAVYGGKLNYSEWYFYHKAMTYTVPVNYRPGITKNRGHCRRCPHNKETLAHVLTGCMFSEGFWNYRHNSVLYCIGEQITQYLDCRVDINVECRYAPSTLRVDLQVYVPGSKILYLIDVKCPYDTKKNMENSNQMNLDHYEVLAVACRAAMPETTVTVLTLQVGCLGTWPKRSTDILTTLKIPPKVIRQIAIGCSVSNVKYSAAQWSYHRDGIVPSGIQRINRINVEEIQEPQEGMLAMEEMEYEHAVPEGVKEFDPVALKALV